jgi:hypothetical protein
MSAKFLWRGTARSLVLSWVLIAIFVMLFGLVVIADAATGDHSSKLSGTGWIAPVGVLVLGVLIAWWSSRVAVEFDAQELRVRFGPGWPMRRIPWSRVISVEYLYVHPLQWGGWGYNLLPRRRTQAIVLRAGDGLRLELSNGRALVITVDQAKRALDAIRKLRSGQ